MTVWYRLWSFVIRLLWPGSWKEHLRSGGRWSRGDENSTGPAVERGDAARKGGSIGWRRCPLPKQRSLTTKLHARGLHLMSSKIWDEYSAALRIVGIPDCGHLTSVR